MERPPCQPTIQSLPFHFILTGVKFTVCSDESPQAGAQTHESAAGTRRTINPALRNMWPRLLSHAHQSAGAPPTCQRVLFLLNALSCPAESGAPLVHSSHGSLRLYVSVYLLGDDFKRALVGQAHPGVGGFTRNLEAADE